VTAPPLDGVDVVVLRVGGGVDEFAASLQALGAAATTLRVADVVDVPDAELRQGAGDLAAYRWVVVTSAQAARRLAIWSASWPPAVQVAAVGGATASAVVDVGVRCDATSPDGTAAGLATRIEHGPVLFLAARGARRELVEALRGRGIDVVVVVAYETVLRELEAADLGTLRDAAVIVATSPSGIDAVRAADGGTELLGCAAVVALGPTTADHAEHLGIRVAAIAPRRDPDSLASAVRAALGR
jgi:uroporphyrinogen-III synthase